MSIILQARCLNHANREAVARCPGCSRMFCRECVTEHHGQVVCAKCLGLAGRKAAEKRIGFFWIVSLSQALAGLFLAWALYYGVGRILLAIPSSFHEGAVWETMTDHE
ncbi:MAG: rhomboid family protein [Lentisphaerota bacterium]